MSVGFGLFRALLRERAKFSEIREAGLSEDYFIGGERRAYEFLQGYYTNYGTYPEERTLAIEIDREDCFSNIPTEPVTFWIDKVRHRYRFQQISNMSARVDELLREDRVDEASEVLVLANSNVLRSGQSNQVIDLSAAQRTVLEAHDSVQQCSEIPGTPIGIEYFDRITGGNQRGDFNVIVGETATGKTFLSLKAGISAQNGGKSVVFISTELPVMQVSRRLLAMRASIDTNLLKMGRLSYFGRQRIQRKVDDSEQMEAFFKILPGGMFSTVDDVDLVVADYQPDLLVVDGAYLLRSSIKSGARWERLMDVAERLKNIALKRETAVMITHQYNKADKGKLDGLSGTQAFSQLASLVYSLEFEKKEDRESTAFIQSRILKLLKGRDGEAGKVLLDFNLRRSSITQNRILSGFTMDELEEVDAYDPMTDEGGDTFEVI